MPATPAQVANDLDAQAAYFLKRDDDIARACRDAARMIRQHLAGEVVDGHTWGALHTRLLNQIGRYHDRPEAQIARSMTRGLEALYEQRAANRC